LGFILGKELKIPFIMSKEEFSLIVKFDMKVIAMGVWGVKYKIIN